MLDFPQQVVNALPPFFLQTTPRTPATREAATVTTTKIATRKDPAPAAAAAARATATMTAREAAAIGTTTIGRRRPASRNPSGRLG